MAASRRNVLFLIPTLAAGGAERVIVTLLNHLDRSKLRLSLGVLDTQGAAFLSNIPGDIDFFDLQSSRVRYALPKIIRLIWRERPDVVFTTLGHLNLALAIARPLLPNKIKYLARETVVVSQFLRAEKFSKAWDFSYRNFYCRFDSIICQSNDMRDDLVASFSIPTKKLIVINNPVDVDRISQLASIPLETYINPDPDFDGEDFIRLAAAGRLVDQKGFDLLIEAVALSGLKQLKVTILGEGPLREDLEQLARSKGVANQVRFVGLQRNPYAFMARAGAFIMCSRFEGFPNVMLEALACGTRVIATPAPGGIAEIAAATGGVQMARARSAEALSTELLEFARNRNKTPPISLDKFRLDKIVKEYEHILAG